MPRQIVIDPVTRIEGHAKITIRLDDAGQVEGDRFHVGEFRGFEKFCEGRPLWEMSSIRRASAASAPSVICFAPPRPAMPSWRFAFLRPRRSCGG